MSIRSQLPRREAVDGSVAPIEALVLPDDGRDRHRVLIRLSWIHTDLSSERDDRDTSHVERWAA